jgi:hypothetical protein
MDFVRFLHGQLLGVVGFLVVLFVVVAIVKKFAGFDEKTKQNINTGRNWLSVAALLLLAWFVFSAATTNRVPRATIDRSVANDRADTVQEQGKEAEEAAKKTAAQQNQKEKGDSR